ncbi:MAG TPA: plastocyanin/azurin family copper-binding protein [Candidatus Limnocylindria bacterium]|nr:plastocyanin/azurin family copper-binding protein [Candidatus Limnocylindria bacterium]
MKKTFLLGSLCSALLLAGCGQKDTSAPAGATASNAPAAKAAAPAGPRVIEITANDQMKYSVTSIEAKPGEDLKVVLTNMGTLPKEAMGHNFVLLKADADPASFAAAAMAAKETDYVPASLAGQVIARIETLGPRKSGEVTFKAPSAPGTYTYLCSFPGHFLIGMKGTLVVK